MSQRTSDYAFQGGMDPSTSPLILNPSQVMAALNYEVVAEGYRRMEGIERFDGKPAPKDARFSVLAFTDGATAIPVGATLTGGTSGATAKVARVILSSGAWTGNAEGTLVLTDLSGTFESGENLLRAGATAAHAYGTAQREAAASYNEFLDYSGAAQDVRRSAIGRPPGSGPIRGVAVFAGTVYAWRDNVAATAGVMWRATSAGWQQVASSRILGFKTGLSEIPEGTVITGATSGASATASRVVRQKGNYAATGGTAEGFIVLSGGAGSFSNGEDIRVGSTAVAKSSGEAPFSFPAGGRYMTIEHNFYGDAPRTALYGVNGVGPAFEFMNGVLAPVRTGMAIDRPTRIFEIANHLGLIYPGGSIQGSSIGEPLVFDAVQGAWEIGFGDEITDVIQANDSAVAIFGRSKIGTLSGRDVDTFVMAELTEDAGSEPWMAQRIGRTIYLDASGLRDLTAVQAFGNFRAGSPSPELQSFFLSRARTKAYPVLSFVSKVKSQYRALWSDGLGLCVYMGRKRPEVMPFDISPLRFTCAAQGEINREEFIICGGEDGYVYRVDSGSSLDGQPIKAYIMPPFNHLGAPNQEKRLHKITVELDGLAGANIGVSAIFNYGEDGQPNAILADRTVFAGGKLWGTANWNEFYWSGAIRGRGEFPADGIGRNIGLIIAAASHPAEGSHTLQAYTLHWSPRRQVR